ncbi:membrane-bound transcription factor site-2 protease [Euwallacea fornicatus]|uniref:membrane-bound transcription factor site-2 protease n=1 Tax=Euwallacea fornicatus TaxID=995702 RepID=UPI00338D84D0
MDLLLFIAIVIGCYCILIFFDLFFKSCAHYPYFQFLDGLGMTLSLFTIKWKTRALNRLLIKWGNLRPQLLTIWFDIGVFCSLTFFFIALYLVLTNTVQILSTTSEATQPLITPVMPGITLPITELWYYCITLLICSIVHELGHALAAVLEDVGILEFGCNLYFILPVAYVSLPTDKLSTVSLRKQLRVFTAGVWHNIVLCFLGYLVYCSLPTIFSPFYIYNKGIVVSSIFKQSPLDDPVKGLAVKDLITSINHCKISSEDEWFDCLSNKENFKPAVCISSDLVHTKDESVPLKHLGGGFVECCDSKNNKNICFELIDIGNNELELPGHVCLPGRTVMEKSTNFCTSSPHSCPFESYCFKPILPNNTFLFKISCNTKYVIFLGHPNDLTCTIEISPYVRKNNYFPISFPSRTTKFLKYVVTISLGLAFVNILPFIFMDGGHVLQIVCLMLLGKKIEKRRTIQVVNVITWLSTILFTIYLIYTVRLLL